MHWIAAGERRADLKMLHDSGAAIFVGRKLMPLSLPAMFLHGRASIA